MCSRVRGPAIAPSFVTWPTSSVGMLRSFAIRTSRCAHSRTWLTDPGTPGTSGSATVWIESTASTSGATSATWVSTCGSEVSATIRRF